MINPELINLIHKATFIERWNDHIRPFTGLTEMDKQAHKTFYAFALAKCQEDSGGEIDYCRLIEGLIFEFLHRIILTDIKPPIYYKIIAEMGEEVNEWVEKQLMPSIKDVKGDFAVKYHKYFNDKSYGKTEKIIIKFAHYLATKWEFDIIYPMNQGMYNIDKTKAEVENSLTDCEWFEGKKVIYQTPGIFDFLNLIGQLRFQQRWTATARIPQTSVMGHTFVVALLSYFFTLEAGGCEKRCENNFFGGLFHDLPEVLTRDIISPVKSGIEGLDEMIKKIEDSHMRNIIYPLIPELWAKQIEYYTMDEFESKITLNNKKEIVSSETISEKYNKSEFNPYDGKIIRACDHLSAYLEVNLSIHNGIASEPLLSAQESLYSRYKDKKICNIDFGGYFKEFKN